MGEDWSLQKVRLIIVKIKNSDFRKTFSGENRGFRPRQVQGSQQGGGGGQQGGGAGHRPHQPALIQVGGCCYCPRHSSDVSRPALPSFSAQPPGFVPTYDHSEQQLLASLERELGV